MPVDSRGSIRSWALWTLTVPAFAVVVLTTLAGLAAGAWLVTRPDAFDGLGPLALLIVAALISVEGARRVERRRRRGGALHKDLSPAWLIAGALVLGPGTALVFVLVMRSWWRIRAGRCIPYRWVFSTAVVVLAVTAVQLTETGLLRLLDPHGPAEVALAMVTAAAAYLVVDALLCGLAISQIVPGSTRRETIGGRDEFSVDATAATLGCLIAAAVMTSPWAAPLAIPIVLTAQRALLLDQLESEAQTDAKTSLARLDWWRKRTELLLRQARPQRDPLAILLIDIDHFKQINDLHGHLVGDEALRAIATILRGTIRSKDVIGRFGGEEFVVALPDVAAGDAAVTADRLRSAVATSPLAEMCAGVLDEPDLDPETLKLTVSVGIAAYPADGQTLDDLLTAADRAMYAAKAAGRDRVRTASEAAVPDFTAVIESPRPQRSELAERRR